MRRLNRPKVIGRPGLDRKLGQAVVVGPRLLAVGTARLARDFHHAAAHRLHQGLELVPVARRLATGLSSKSDD